RTGPLLYPEQSATSHAHTCSGCENPASRERDPQEVIVLAHAAITAMVANVVAVIMPDRIRITKRIAKPFGSWQARKSIRGTAAQAQVLGSTSAAMPRS